MRLNEAEQVALDLLASVGEVQRAVETDDTHAHLILTTPDGGRHLFEVKSYASVRPSDRRLLDSPRPAGVTRIVVAPRISELAARELDAAGLSWAAIDGPAH